MVACEVELLKSTVFRWNAAAYGLGILETIRVYFSTDNIEITVKLLFSWCFKANILVQNKGILFAINHVCRIFSNRNFYAQGGSYQFLPFLTRGGKKKWAKAKAALF